MFQLLMNNLLHILLNYLNLQNILYQIYTIHKIFVNYFFVYFPNNTQNNYFSLNPSLNKIDFFIKNGEFDIAADFEVKYNLRDLKESFSTNLLSDEPYAVHIGKYKKLIKI